MQRGVARRIGIRPFQIGLMRGQVQWAFCVSTGGARCNWPFVSALAVHVLHMLLLLLQLMADCACWYLLHAVVVVDELCQMQFQACLRLPQLKFRSHCAA